MKLGTRIAATASAAALAIVGWATPAAIATTVVPNDGQEYSGQEKCYEEQEYVKYEYEKTKEVTYYQYRTRTEEFSTTKVKEVKGWKYSEGGETKVNGTTVGGHWEPTGTFEYFPIPDVIAIALWGPGGLDDHPLGDGTTTVRVDDERVTVKYRVTEPTTSLGYGPWSAWSEWSKTDPGPSTDALEVASKTETKVIKTIWSEDPELGEPWTKTGETKTKTRKVEVECPPPPPPVECENLLGEDGEMPFVPEGIQVVDPGHGKDCYYVVYVCWEVTDPYDDFPNGTELYPLSYVSHGAARPMELADCTDVVPLCEEVLQYGWTKYVIDSWIDSKLLDELITNGLDFGTYQAGKPDDATILYKKIYGTFEVVGDECPPPPAPEKVSLCEVVDGVATEVVYTEGTEPEDGITWVDGSECEPNLTGTFIGNLCQGDVPYFTYDVVVNDPTGSVDPSALPTLTWVNPGGEDLVIELTSFAGQMLWPGASASPLGWPGWELNEATGEYEEVGDDNFGWTRDGVQVIISVNPETTVTAEYPPATSDCNGPDEEDEEFESVLSAGPAVPVRGVATYAG